MEFETLFMIIVVWAIILILTTIFSVSLYMQTPKDIDSNPKYLSTLYVINGTFMLVNCILAMIIALNAQEIMEKVMFIAYIIITLPIGITLLTIRVNKISRTQLMIIFAAIFNLIPLFVAGYVLILIFIKKDDDRHLIIDQFFEEFQQE